MNKYYVKNTLCDNWALVRSAVSINEVVVIKTFPKLNNSMITEISSLLSLKHDNIIAVKEIINEPENYGFVMSWISLSLSDMINGSPVIGYMGIYLQIATALDYIHTMGFIHRDIKPENIMIMTDNSQSCRVKLIDFGLAYYEGFAGDISYNYMVQSRGYRAPEILKESSYSNKIDIWGLEVIRMEMELGYNPFISVKDIAGFKRVYSNLDEKFKTGLRIRPYKRMSAAEILIEYGIEPYLSNKYARQVIINPPQDAEDLNWLFDIYTKFNLSFQSLFATIVLYSKSMWGNSFQRMVISMSIMNRLHDAGTIAKSYFAQVLNISIDKFKQRKNAFLKSIRFKIHSLTPFHFADEDMYIRSLYVMLNMKTPMTPEHIVNRAKKVRISRKCVSDQLLSLIDSTK